MIINVTIRWDFRENCLEVILSNDSKDTRFRVPESEVSQDLRFRGTRRSEIDLGTAEGRKAAQRLAELIGRPADALIG